MFIFFRFILKLSSQYKLHTGKMNKFSEKYSSTIGKSENNYTTWVFNGLRSIWNYGSVAAGYYIPGFWVKYEQPNILFLFNGFY